MRERRAQGHRGLVITGTRFVESDTPFARARGGAGFEQADLKRLGVLKAFRDRAMKLASETESVDVLDREPHIDFRRSIGKDQLSLGAMPLMLHCGFSLRPQLTLATSAR
jgi:hypothetical protein